jgi:hypothetical protein
MPIGVVKDSIQAFTDGRETFLCSSAFDKCVPELGQRVIESRVAHHTVGGLADLRADRRVGSWRIYHPNASLMCRAEFEHNAPRHEQVLKVILRRRGLSPDAPGAQPLSKGKAEVHKQGRGRHARFSSVQTAHKRTFLSDIDKPRGEGTLLCEGQTSCLPRWLVP